MKKINQEESSKKNTTKPLTAVVLLATLKPKNQLSHTAVLAKLLIEKLGRSDIQSEMIRLIDYDIKVGTRENMGKGDEWSKILKKILAADIIIFATPIWWGLHSSLMQRVVERMDTLNDSLLETGTSPLANKVASLVITGAEDGAQHITGNLLSFITYNGMTIPPGSSVSWLGDAEWKSEEQLTKLFNKEPTKSMIEVAGNNIVHVASFLREQPYPKANQGIRGSIKSGTVGIKS